MWLHLYEKKFAFRFNFQEHRVTSFESNYKWGPNRLKQKEKIRILKAFQKILNENSTSRVKSMRVQGNLSLDRLQSFSFLWTEARKGERNGQETKKRVNLDATRYKPDTSSSIINFKFGPFAPIQCYALCLIFMISEIVFFHTHTHMHTLETIWRAFDRFEIEFSLHHSFYFVSFLTMKKWMPSLEFTIYIIII